MNGLTGSLWLAVPGVAHMFRGHKSMDFTKYTFFAHNTGRGLQELVAWGHHNSRYKNLPVHINATR